MTPFAQALSTALVHFVWQASVAGLAAWLALYLLRGRSAEARYAVGCAALGLTALLPAVTAWLIYPSAANPHALSVGAAVARTGIWVGVGPVELPWFAGLRDWVLPVWGCGVLLLSLRLVIGMWQTYTVRRSGEPVGGGVLEILERVAERLQLARPVCALTSLLCDGPAVVGWIRPVVLLPPAAMLGLTTGQLEAVIAHELAHLKRLDPIVNILQMLVETVLFYHPAVWWLSARIRHERELCCDDMAVRCCGDAVCYARALVCLERQRIAAPVAAMGSTSGPLLYRIQRVLGVAARDGGYARLPGVLAVLLVLACVGLEAGWQLPSGQDQLAERFAAPDETSAEAHYRNQAAERQADLYALQEQLYLVGMGRASETARRRDELLARIRQERARLEDAQRGLARAMLAPSSTEDCTLRFIEVKGLAGARMRDLLARLPVSAGDTLTGARLERLSAAVREYDEHLALDVRVVRSRDVEIRILASDQVVGKKIRQ